MAELLLALTEDPSVTRTASEESFRRWNTIPGLDADKYRAGSGKKVWEVVTPEVVARRTVKAPPPMPKEILKPKELDEPTPAVAEPVVEAKAEELPAPKAAKAKSK